MTKQNLLNQELTHTDYYQIVFNLLRFLVNEEKINLESLSDEQSEEFLKIIFKEGLSGVIYQSLIAQTNNYFLPKASFKKLEDEYLTNVGRNMLIRDELESICQEFKEDELDALVVRGATLFDQLYPQLGMRPLIDMDFVVHEKDFTRAQLIFKDLGFEYHPEYPFFIFKNDIYVDLHLDSINFWRIKSWPSAITINNEDLLEQTIPFKECTTVRQLDTYDAILHCCEHLQRHSFDRLIWFMDIVYLLKAKHDFNWEYFITRAKKFNIHKPTYFVLSYLNKQQVVNIPEDSLKDLGRFHMNRYEKRCFAFLLNDQRTEISGDLLSLFNITSLTKRFVVLWHGIFMPKDKFTHIGQKVTPWTYMKRFYRLTAFALRKFLAMFKMW